jgi:hypothetical protein
MKIIAFSVRYTDARGCWQVFAHASRARVSGFKILQDAAGRQTEPVRPVFYRSSK